MASDLDNVVELNSGKRARRKKPPHRVADNSGRPAEVTVRRVTSATDSPVVGLWIRRWMESDVEGVGQQPEDKQITDCDLTVVCTVDVDGQRHFQVHITRGTLRVLARPLPVEVLEDYRKWNAWASNADVLCWNLDEEARWALKYYLFQQPGSRRTVYQPKTSGYHPQFGVFLTQGVAIDSCGEPHPAAPGEPTGEMMCSDGQRREFIVPDGAPVMPEYRAPHATVREMEVLAQESAEALRTLIAAGRANLGNHALALSLGWLVAGIRGDDVHRRERGFPILYLLGARGAGKNVLGDILMQLDGVRDMPLKAGAGTTIPGLRNTSEECCNFAMWLDEARNDGDMERTAAWSRGMFDRQRQVTAGRQRGLTREDHRPLRHLLISGQDLLGSDAEITRCCVLQMTKRSLSPEAFGVVNSALPAAAVAVARLRARAMEPEFANALAWALRMFKDQLTATAAARGAAIPPRQIFCWATLLAGLMVALHPDPLTLVGSGADHGVFGQDVFDECAARMLSVHDVAVEDSAISKFWGVLESMSDQGARLSNMGEGSWTRLVPNGDHDAVAVRIPYLVQRVREHTHQDHSERMLTTEFEAAEGFIGRRRVRFNAGGGPKAVLVFAQDSEVVPPWVLRMAANHKDGSMEEGT